MCCGKGPTCNISHVSMCVLTVSVCAKLYELGTKIGRCHFKQMKAQLLSGELHALVHNYRYSDLSSTPSRAL